ncbi:glutaredoxin domain-containing protein [Clostridium niameyense]|uniref:glutaredoxin domain-containing protein n=1 Tax=Clostridium niameyense TaxID=1622073 RepID=UPI000B1DB9FB
MLVKVYSIPTCSWCEKTKKYLDSKNVQYETIDIESDLEGRQKMFEISHQKSVPVIDIDGEVIIGFQKDKLDELLKL